LNGRALFEVLLREDPRYTPNPLHNLKRYKLQSKLKGNADHAVIVHVPFLFLFLRAIDIIDE